MSDHDPSRPPREPGAETDADSGVTTESATVRTGTDDLVCVGTDSYLTLHYRLTLADTGADVINTFEGKPATLQLGIGQMAESLERRLLGLPEGARRVFELEPSEAFGPRNPDLVQRVSRAMLTANSDAGASFEPGELVDFPAPDGGRFAGVLKQIDERSALFDFNHPLAGQRIRFEVRILGIL